MLGRKVPQRPAISQGSDNGSAAAPITLLTIVGEHAKIEGLGQHK